MVTLASCLIPPAIVAPLALAMRFMRLLRGATVDAGIVVALVMGDHSKINNSALAAITGELSVHSVLGMFVLGNAILTLDGNVQAILLYGP